MNRVIELINVTFTYEGSSYPAVKNVNLTISKGELVAIIGPLGSGKTTILRVISGLIPKFYPGRLQGRIRVYGFDPSKIDPRDLSKLIGLVLDNPWRQVFNLTVIDDILLGLLCRGVDYNEAIKRAKHVIKLLSLEGLEDRNPKELSSGQMQRVALAGILALEPKIILLDEPLPLLDPRGKRGLLNLLRMLVKDREITCILTDTGINIDLLIEFVDRIIIMDRGVIVLDARVGELDKYTSILESHGVPKPSWPRHHISVTRKNLFRHDQALGDVILEAHNIYYKYPNDVWAIKGISLKVFGGEVIGLIGCNGSGKTTLSLCLAGILKPVNPDGYVKILNKNIHSLDPSIRVRLVNYVSHDPDRSLVGLTIIDEVILPLKFTGESIDKHKQWINEMLKVTGLDTYSNERVHRMPRNVRSLAALLSALSLKPKVLIIDEMIDYMDLRSLNIISKIIKILSKLGTAIIVATHNMDFVLRHCDRVLVLSDGRVIAEDRPINIFTGRLSELRRFGIEAPREDNKINDTGQGE